MRIVLDTNVVVSGLLRPDGPPAKVLQLIARGEVHLCFDERIITEYREVLSRPRFGFDPQAVNALLGQIEADGIPVVCQPLQQHLPDPDDDAFAEATTAGNAACLVTGNLRHFPPETCGPILVLTPRQFLERFDELEVS